MNVGGRIDESEAFIELPKIIQLIKQFCTLFSPFSLIL